MQFPVRTDEFDRLGIHPDIVHMDLKDQLTGEHKPIQSKLRASLENEYNPIWEVDKEDRDDVLTLVQRFINDAPKEERDKYLKFINRDKDDLPTVEDILILAANLVMKASGEHDDKAGIDNLNPHLMDFLNLDFPPLTACRIFNRAFKHVFEILAKEYNADILEKFALMMTQARLSTDLPVTRDYIHIGQKHIKIHHIFLSLISYDGENIQVSTLDPYHIEREPLNKFTVLSLDFGHSRSIDSVEQAWDQLDKKLGRSGFMRESDVYRTMKTDWNQFRNYESKLSYALLLIEMSNYLKEEQYVGINWNRNEVANNRIRRDNAQENLDILRQNTQNVSDIEAQEQFVEQMNTILSGSEQTLDRVEKEYEILILAFHDILEDYIFNIRTDDITPVQLASLAKLIDYAGANGINITDEQWNRINELILGISGNSKVFIGFEEQMRESLAFYRRSRKERLFLPLYLDSKEQAKWIDYKIKYYSLLVQLGIEEWINVLPHYTDIPGIYNDIIYLFNPDIPKTKETEIYEGLYKSFISKLRLSLEKKGYPELSKRIQAVVEYRNNA